MFVCVDICMCVCVCVCVAVLQRCSVLFSHLETSFRYFGSSWLILDTCCLQDPPIRSQDASETPLDSPYYPPKRFQKGPRVHGTGNKFERTGYMITPGFLGDHWTHGPWTHGPLDPWGLLTHGTLGPIGPLGPPGIPWGSCGWSPQGSHGAQGSHEAPGNF